MLDLNEISIYHLNKIIKKRTEEEKKIFTQNYRKTSDANFFTHYLNDQLVSFIID